MRGSASLVAVLAPLLLLPAGACAQQDRSAEAALRQGEYADAIEILQKAVEEDPQDLEVRRALASALIEVGRYNEAAIAAESLHNLRGEALEAIGRLDEAAGAYQQAIDAGGHDRWTAELNLGEIEWRRGNVDDALARFDQFIDLYNSSPDLTAEELTAIGNAVWYLGVRDPQLFQDAVMAFDEATKRDPEWIEAHIRLAELFVEKYNSAEAHKAITDALALSPAHPRALLASAKVRSFDGARGQALELVTQALETNPNLVPARVFLARMNLDVEDIAGAREELNRALEVDPSSLEALSMLAAVQYISEDRSGYQATRRQVEAINPRYAGLLTTVAEIAAQVRRYSDAEQLAEEATRLDPQAWPSYGVLGLNRFRTGDIEGARAALETSFTGDPYNVWIKNNLDLLDTFEEYEVREHPGFEFMVHRDEADLLDAYLRVAAVEAYANLSERYADQSRGRIRIEMYPRSADFSVRTVGLAGLGALGVSFGDVLALDSPSAREAGSYNWLTTLWHEMAHTITLGVSNNRVPRWITEGISVWEERRARPSWGTHITPEVLLMYDDEELPPVSRLNEGFMRPESPRHLAAAYDVASLVVDWIQETRGHEAIIAMLHGYRDGLSDEEIIRRVLRIEPEEMDQQFDAWVRTQASPERAREFMELFTLGRDQFAAGNLSAAKRTLERAGELFPVAETGSPYAVLAQIHQREGNEDGVVEALTTLTEYDENAYQPNLELARLLEERGDLARAAAALERAVWIYPYEPAPHVRLAELYTELEDWPRAVRERRAVVALTPTDRAGALFQLAVALRNAGDRAGARAEVLRALEIAPAFEEAQALLLELHENTD